MGTTKNYLPFENAHLIAVQKQGGGVENAVLNGGAIVVTPNMPSMTSNTHREMQVGK